jgi:glycosyltransferase involved in cell wall biosynthesis
MMDKNKMPLVTIVVPCYNHEKYIKDTIESIINQTYKNIELIVIDDGSKDNSAKVIHRLTNKYNFIFITRLNKGLCATLNEGINLAKGSYFCACASDDKYTLDKIEKQVKFMESNPNFAMCYGNKINFNDTGDQNKIKVLNPTSGWIFEDIILNNTIIPALTTMQKINVLKDLDGYDENLFIEDWDMWLRIADKYEIGYLDEYLGYYRTHERNISKQKLKMYEGQKTILDKWINKERFKFYLSKQKLKWLNFLAIEHKKQAKNYIYPGMSQIFTSEYLKGIIKLFFINIKLKRKN